jgi:hypothetical protein
MIFAVACHVPDQSAIADSQTPVVDPKIEELKYSRFCTEAAEKFWSRHDFKENQDVRRIVSYTSHYNKKLNKCLVDVHSSYLLKGEVSETDHVYNALEDTVLGGRVLLRKGGLDGEIETVAFIKDGRTIRDKREAAVFVPWFQGLMTE